MERNIFNKMVLKFCLYSLSVAWLVRVLNKGWALQGLSVVMEWCTWFVPKWAFLFVGFWKKKKKILQDNTANCFLSPCEIDLKHVHGGFPPVFNKTSKPISIHFCHQFLLPFSFAFCLRRFTGSRPVAGVGGVCIGTGVYQLVIWVLNLVSVVFTWFEQAFIAC